MTIEPASKKDEERLERWAALLDSDGGKYSDDLLCDLMNLAQEEANKTYNVLLYALRFYADPKNWKEVETGIGMWPSDAECDNGTKARAAIAEAEGKE